MTGGAALTAVAAAVAFWLVEQRHADPLVRADLLKLPSLRKASTVNILLGLWNAGEMIVLSIYFQQVLHDSPLATGLAIAPQGIVGFAARMPGARLAGRVGVRRVLILTSGQATAGVLILTQLPATGSYSLLLAAVMPVGFGTAGTAFGTMVIASGGVADSDQGLVGGVVNTSRQMGAAIGAALLPAVAVAVNQHGAIAGVAGRRPGRHARGGGGRRAGHARRPRQPREPGGPAPPSRPADHSNRTTNRTTDRKGELPCSKSRSARPACACPRSRSVPGSLAATGARPTNPPRLPRSEGPPTRVALEKILHHEQPIVITHPATGKKALYVSRLMSARIEGFAPAESEAALAQLFDIAEDPAIVYEHEWRLGDLVVWDNWCSIHARKDFPREEKRLMRRCTIEGQALRY